MIRFHGRTTSFLQFLVRSILVMLVVLMVPSTAFAAEVRGGDSTTVSAGETINDDLYIAGGNVSILGTINGDVVVAGGTVTIVGPVHGDVLAVAGTTTVQGPVGRNVRVTGGTVRVDSNVTQDVAVAGGNVTLGPAAQVGRDLLVGAGTAVLDGVVNRNAKLGGGDVTLNGRVGGNVSFNGTTLRLGNSASIAGDLTYTSTNELVTAGPGVVRGRVVSQPRPATVSPSLASMVVSTGLGWLRGVIGLFALGAILVLLFPAFSRRAVETIRVSPFASVVGGFVTLFVVPILAILIFALGLAVGGWWLGLAVLALYAIALALGLTVAALFAGTWILEHASNPNVPAVLALLLGVVLLLLIGLLPMIGGLVIFAALLFGLGALMIAAYRARQEATHGRAFSVTA